MTDPVPADAALVAEALQPVEGDGVHIVSLDVLPADPGLAGWVVTTAKGRYVIKTRGDGEAQWRYEAAMQVHRLAEPYELPAPALLHAAPLPNPLGVEHFCIAWVPGEDAEKALPQLSPADLTLLAQDIGRALARVHAMGGRTFERPLMGIRGERTWRGFCRRYWEVAMAEDAGGAPIPPEAIAGLAQRCQLLINYLPEDQKPQLLHGGLSLADVIVQEGRFQALTGFELAWYGDPAWDLVKLHDRSLQGHPELDPGAVKRGYTSLATWPADIDLRMYAYTGLELLYAVRRLEQVWPGLEQMVQDWLMTPPERILPPSAQARR